MVNRVGGHQTAASVTPTISTSAYASGDLIGTKMEFKLGRWAGKNVPQSGLIQSVVLADLDNEGVTVDVVFFGSDPSSTTFTDNAALDIAAADLDKVVGVVRLSSYVAFADNSVAEESNLGIPFSVGDDGIVYAAIVSRATPTYTATSDLTLSVRALAD